MESRKSTVSFDREGRNGSNGEMGQEQDEVLIDDFMSDI